MFLNTHVSTVFSLTDFGPQTSASLQEQEEVPAT